MQAPDHLSYAPPRPGSERSGPLIRRRFLVGLPVRAPRISPCPRLPITTSPAPSSSVSVTISSSGLPSWHEIAPRCLRPLLAGSAARPRIDGLASLASSRLPYTPPLEAEASAQRECVRSKRGY